MLNLFFFPKPIILYRRSSCKRLLVLIILISSFTACRSPTPKIQIRNQNLIFAYDKTELVSESFQRNTNTFLEEIADSLSIPIPEKPATLVIFDSSWSSWKYLRKHCPTFQFRKAASFRGPSGFEIVVALDSSQAENYHRIRHELVHYLLNSRYYNLPPWIDEGLAQYFEWDSLISGSSEKEKKSLIKTLSHATLIDLESLVVHPAGSKLSRNQYLYSLGLVIFLLDYQKKDFQTILNYLGHVHSGPSSRDEFCVSFGICPDGLFEDWQVWLNSLSNDLGFMEL